MKKWLKKAGNHCLMVLNSPVTWILLVLYCFALLSTMTDAAKNLVLWKYMVTLPEPKVCALCTNCATVWDAPCLVTLETGEVAEIAADQSVTLPKDAAYIRPNLFCHDCRAKIAEVIEVQNLYTEGYVLADLHDLKNIRVYSIADGAEYDIWGDTVKIAQNKRSEGLTVTVAR